MTHYLIQVQALTIGYKSALLKNLHFSLASGEVLVILGANGVGKSTLLHTLLGLQAQITGAIHISAKRRGFMPQLRPLSRHLPMTTADFLRIFDWYSPSWKKKIIFDLELDPLLETSVAQLSQGMWQRVNLAQALSSQPDLLFLDEPTQGLDVRWQDKMYHYLSTYVNDFKSAVCCISHDSVVISTYANKALCLDHQPLHDEILEKRILQDEHSSRPFQIYIHEHMQKNCCKPSEIL